MTRPIGSPTMTSYRILGKGTLSAGGVDPGTGAVYEHEWKAGTTVTPVSETEEAALVKAAGLGFAQAVGEDAPAAAQGTPTTPARRTRTRQKAATRSKT